MITFLTALFGGVISAVITLVLGQPLQHYFWRRQRQAERQLVIIDEVNRLASEFMANFLAHPKGCLTPDFFRQFRAASSNVNVLFSEHTVQLFYRLEVLVASYAPNQHLLGPSHDQSVDDFVQTQNDTLRALYSEVGIPTPPPREWLRAKMLYPVLEHCRESLWPKLTKAMKSRN